MSHRQLCGCGAFPAPHFHTNSSVFRSWKLSVDPEPDRAFLVEWQPIDKDTPADKLLLVWQGGNRFAWRDKLGQWRRWNGRPIEAPIAWMHLMPKPEL